MANPTGICKKGALVSSLCREQKIFILLKTDYMGRPRLTIQDMQETANVRGGNCLSKRYFGSSRKLWECSEGHHWKAAPEQVRFGSWCPECKRIKVSIPWKYDIQNMNKFAQKKGGRCLSKKYVNPITKLEWECVEGHQWEAVPNNVLRGRWCPHCWRES